MANNPVLLAVAEQRERLFFFMMALCVLAVVLAGFGGRVAVGMSSFTKAPWYLHVHGISMMAWIGLYVVQNWLVWRGDVTLHRKLGKLGFVFAPLLVATTVPMFIYMDKTDSFLDPRTGLLLAPSAMRVLVFAVMVVVAILIAKRIDWHRRLMLSATAILILLGWLRIGERLTENATIFGQGVLLMIAACMIFDKVNRGKVHPAWYWGLAAHIFLMAITIVLLAGVSNPP